MRLLPVGLCVAVLAVGAITKVSAAPAYWIAELEITDAAKLKEFGTASNPVVAKYGGVFLSRRNKPEAALGTPPSSVTIIQFESMEKARAYLNSPELKALEALRNQAARFHAYLVPGGDSAQ